MIGLFRVTSLPSRIDRKNCVVLGAVARKGGRYGIVGVLYHKGLVKPEDAPKSIEDVVNRNTKACW
jgi:hypothetical protein